jgi:hypothetical protein
VAKESAPRGSTYAKAAGNLAWSGRALRSACSCLNLILACIVYWQRREISRVLSQCDPLANGIDLSLLEHVSPVEWDNVVLYGQYILDRKLVRQRRRTKRVGLSV